MLKIPFATAISVLSRMFEKGLLNRQEALEKLEPSARHRRYKKGIVAAHPHLPDPGMAPEIGTTATPAAAGTDLKRAACA